jgi:Ca-activated chloride channel family protein
VSFAQPLWFIGLALLPALAALFIRNESRRNALLRKLVAARLQERLAGSVSAGKRRWRFALALLGLACVIVSLAQPRYGSTWEESRRHGRDVLIAIDCSRSMLSTDVVPNRLVRAKLAAQDLIGQLDGDRVGLIAFAGTAFLQAPLTADYGAVLDSLSELDTDIIPRGGTDITAAIKEASDAFGKGESDNRCLILMTDGEDLEEDSITAAKDLNGAIRIFTVGLGSTNGSLIPLPNAHGETQFVKDDNGEIVKSRLDEERLRKIAESTGGFYVHLLSGPAEMKQIATEGLGKMNEKELDIKMSRRPIERYQWSLAAGMALIVGSMFIGERRRTSGLPPPLPAGLASTLALALAMIFPRSARATNGGLEAYDRQDYGGAQEQFSDQLKRLPDSQGLQFDLGAAAYKSGDYGKALEAFAKAVTSTDIPLREAAEYNLGNTLYQRGAALEEKEPKIKEWKSALEHYDQALSIDPQNKDARYNRDLVQRLIEQQEKEEKQQQQQQQKKDKKDKKDDKDQEDQQQKQQKGNGKQDQQKGGQQGQQQNQSQGQKGDQQDQQQQQQAGNSKPDKDGQQQQQQQQPKEGKEGEQAKNDPQQGKNDSQKGKDGKDQQAANGKDSQGKKDQGNAQAQASQGKKDAKQQEAEEAQAAREGKMTETQARELLDSLKNEDQRVQLLKPDSRKYNARSFKDW